MAYDRYKDTSSDCLLLLLLLVLVLPLLPVGMSLAESAAGCCWPLPVVQSPLSIGRWLASIVVCHIRTFTSGFPAIVLFGFCLFTVIAKMFVVASMHGSAYVCVCVCVCHVCLAGFRLSKPHTPVHAHSLTHTTNNKQHKQDRMSDQFNTWWHCWAFNIWLPLLLFSVHLLKQMSRADSPPIIHVANVINLKAYLSQTKSTPHAVINQETFLAWHTPITPQRTYI